MSDTFRSDPFALDEDIAPVEADIKPTLPPVASEHSVLSEADAKPKADTRSAVVPRVEKFADKPRKAGRKRRGRPISANPKRQITLRLDAEIIEYFKATGKGWQTRINDALRDALP